MDQQELPLSRPAALLAVLPGLLATAGLVRTDFSPWMLAGLILLTAYLACAYGWNHRRLPAWSLMAAGMLASAGLTMASGVAGGLVAIGVGAAANGVVLVVLWAALVAILGVPAQGQRVPPLVWALLAAVVACQLGTRVKYFALFGVSWPVVGQWLSISLYSTAIALLLPVALGWPLARQHGPPAMLFALGMIYGGFQLLIDVNDRVSGRIGDTPGFVAYKVLIPLLFTVIAPLWFLRARRPAGQLGGLLALVGLAMILDLVVVGWSYGGDLPPIIWISFAPYTIGVLLALTAAHLLYRSEPSAPA
jgi:hypothetical protein